MTELQLELFWRPYLAGLLLASLLALLGMYLRLRAEWLAALAYGQVGAAGALLALAVGVSTALGGICASLGAALGKSVLVRHGERGMAFVLLLLLGWGGSVLLTSNLPMAERLGQALFEGQLYFVGQGHLYLAGAGLLVVAAYLYRYGRLLLLARLFPAYFQGRGLAGWPVHLGFDLVAAAGLAVAVMGLGVMASFALACVPAWVAFGHAGNWRRATGLALGIGICAYTLAFVAALYFDQVFGPLLGLLLVATGVVAGRSGTGPGRFINQAP